MIHEKIEIQLKDSEFKANLFTYSWTIQLKSIRVGRTLSGTEASGHSDLSGRSLWHDF